MFDFKLRIVPTTLRKANDFVSVYHRHSLRTARNGGKFAIAVRYSGAVVGVAIVGNPLSASFMDGFTAEVLRSCVMPEAPKNCNSVLYGACRRIWFEMGGKKLITYTLTSESGKSLRGAGWKLVAEIKGHDPDSWGKSDHLKRQSQQIIKLPKYRWETVNEESEVISLIWPKVVIDAGKL